MQMHPHELKLSYPLGDTLPAPGEALAVADGVWWVKLPLPFALNHVNVWLLRDRIDGRDGWTVVDCGVDRPELREQWEQVFANFLQGLPILRVIVTHMHPDHMGLAHWLCERWKAPLWMTMTDFMVARLWSQGMSGGPNGESAAEHFMRHGLKDPKALDSIRARTKYYPGLVPAVPSSYRRIMHEDHIDIGGRAWRVIVGYGHAPEHASLYCEQARVLIAGDMLLPRISTNVSVHDYEPEANPLPLYLNSLRRFDDVADDTLVLPSHGRPFRGAHERIAQQHAHHAERLSDLLAACGEPRTTMDVLPVLFKRELDHHQLTFAMGEALAHLNALYFEGKLRRQAGEDGVWRFVRTQA